MSDFEMKILNNLVALYPELVRLALAGNKPCLEFIVKNGFAAKFSLADALRDVTKGELYGG